MKKIYTIPTTSTLLDVHGEPIMVPTGPQLPGSNTVDNGGPLKPQTAAPVAGDRRVRVF